MTYKHLNPVTGIILADNKNNVLLETLSGAFLVAFSLMVLVSICFWDFNYILLRCMSSFYIVSLSANFYYWKDIDKQN